MTESEYLQRAREYREAKDRTSSVARTALILLDSQRDAGTDLRDPLETHLAEFREALGREQVARGALERASQTIKVQAL